MKPWLLSFLAFGLATTAAAQTAGEVPPGGTALQTNVDLVLTTPNTQDSASLELDCDDGIDAWAVLLRGMPEADGPNWVAIHFVDDDMEVCADLSSGYTQRPKYHAFGEELDCAGDFEWQSVPELYIGDYGGFFMHGPATIDSQYVAYRRGGEVGWILLSFHVDFGAACTFQVHEVLPLCGFTTDVDEAAAEAGFALGPNPGNGEGITVVSTLPLRSIEVFDATGRAVAQYPGTWRTIPAPEASGTYLVRATHADGQRSTVRWVRQ